MKRKNKILIFLCLILVSIVCCSSNVSADFISSEQEISNQLSIDKTNNIILVSSEAALRTVCENDIFNDLLPTSLGTGRRYIKLQSNLTLSTPLLITADCNIDFNGFFIDLNGNNVKILNTYHGNLVLTNGQLLNTHSNTAYFDIETPNAVVEYDIIDALSLIKIIDFDKQAVLLAALDMAENVLSKGDLGNNFHNDIDLVENYYGYPVSFRYVSDNQNILSNFGKVTIGEGQYATVNLTIIVSIDDKGTILTENRIFAINITHINDYQAWSNIGLGLFDENFSKYKNLAGDDYTIYSNIILPNNETYISNGEYTAVYTYRSLTDIDGDGEEISADVIRFEGYTQLKARLTASESMYLEVTCTYGLASSSKVYSIVSKNYNDIYLIANLIAEELFGKQIEIFTDETFSSGYTEHLLSDGQSYSHYGVTKINYAFINNNNVYEIYHDILKVADSSVPTEIQLTFLELEIVFGSIEVKVSIPIIYYETGDATARFKSYFPYFNGLFAERTNYNITYQSFEMPFCYYSRVPIIKFEIFEDEALYTGDAITLSFITSNRVYTLEEYETLINGLNSSTLTTLLNDPQARWMINFSWEKLGKDSLNIRFKYYYKFNIATSWNSSEEFFSSFLMPGIINSTYIPDPILYSKILSLYSPGEQQIIASKIARRPAVEPLVISLNNGESILNFKGIELLAGVTKLSLKGIGLSDAGLFYVGQMTQLNYLNISGNKASITDITNLRNLVNLEILDISDNQIRRFDTLKNLPYIKTVYLQNNTFSGWNGILYGSTGFLSQMVFMELTYQGTDRSVDIYNQNTTTPYRADATNLNNYNALKSIVYQYRLPTGISINNIYDTLSKNYKDYSVTGSGFLPSHSITYNTTEDAGVFYIQFATGFLGLTTFRVYYEIIYY